MNSSLENTCATDYQYQCRNKNFMYNKQSYWTLNGYGTMGWGTRIVISSGQANNFASYSSGEIRPVVTLKHSVLISGGTGTAADPYIIKW